MKKALKVIALLLVIALLVGVFLAIYKLSNGFKSDIKTFYVTLDGDIITENASDVYVMDKPIKVHTVGELVQGKEGFSYKIYRNPSADDFVFTIDGEEHKFSEIEDYTKGFAVEVTKDGIMIKRQTFESVLRRIYGDGELELSGIEAGKCYFTLVIYNADSKKSIAIDFLWETVMIEFDHTHLEF